jgi:UDP-glucuronate 4-epimerase
MRVLITGAAGFIGSHVADRLLREGHSVTGLDNFDPYYDPEQKRRNIAEAREQTGYRFVECDVRHVEALGRVFDVARPDAVVHLAARAGVRSSLEAPQTYVEVNELGGLHVLEQCRRRSLLPLVLASTSSVYGSTAQAPFSESDAATEPLSPYAASKRSAELMAYAFHHIYGQPVAITRFFTVYGPRGRPDMAFAKFTRSLLAGETIELHGEETERDFTYIDDIVDGVVGALGWVVRERGWDTFNLGRSEPVRVSRLIDLLASALGVTAHVRVGTLKPGESPRTAADVSKAGRVLGYAPRVSLEQGVSYWLEWLVSSEAPADFRAALNRSSR